METLRISLAGGEVADDLTASGGSSPVCDGCGAPDELKSWESSDKPGAKVYSFCKVCWFDVRDSAEELEELNAEASEYDGGCDDCGSPTALTSEFWHNDGRTFHLCENCYQSADHSAEYLEPDPKRQELQCQDCGKNPASHTFNHLDGRTFRLCEYCFQLADHDDDYGAEFGSASTTREADQPAPCTCPLPCDFVSPTQCVLCHGVVVS